MLDSPSNSDKTLVSVPDHKMVLAPYQCRSGGWAVTSAFFAPQEKGIACQWYPEAFLVPPQAAHGRAPNSPATSCTSLPPTLGNRIREFGSPDLDLIFLWKVKKC